MNNEEEMGKRKRCEGYKKKEDTERSEQAKEDEQRKEAEGVGRNL